MFVLDNPVTICQNMVAQDGEDCVLVAVGNGGAGLDGCTRHDGGYVCPYYDADYQMCVVN